MTKVVNEIGHRYGRLVVLERAENDRFGKAQWLCQCDCGNKKVINGSSLRKGLTVSCGCNKDEKMKQYNESKVIDETGHVYGYLTVISRNLDKELQKDGRAMWNCQCICGNICVASGKMLREGKVTSCGCRIQSVGEETVEKILLSKDISYVKEYPIKVPNRDKKLRVDFMIVDDKDNIKYGIEYDGEQHFHHKGGAKTWNNEENFKRTQENDSLKNQWFKDHNIPLIRIPYTHLNNLCLNDLLLETSKFIV